MFSGDVEFHSLVTGSVRPLAIGDWSSRNLTWGELGSCRRFGFDMAIMQAEKVEAKRMLWEHVICVGGLTERNPACMEIRADVRLMV